MRSHAFHHLLDMRDRGLRLEAVAAIEDRPALGEIRQHLLVHAIDNSLRRERARDNRNIREDDRRVEVEQVWLSVLIHC
jgi:hypothetical protein